MLCFLHFCFIGALINRNLLSEFEELESGVVEHHTQLREGRAHAETPDSHQSLQSLSDSFEELQQRYKQLKDDSARKLKVHLYMYS